MRDTQRERGRDIGRGRSRLHAGSLTWDLILNNNRLKIQKQTFVPVMLIVYVLENWIFEKDLHSSLQLPGLCNLGNLYFLPFTP